MFREKFIAKVPDTAFEGVHFPLRGWQRTFNVACWIRFQSPRPNRLALLLRFVDDGGQKEVEVDHCHTELETTVLLSAHAVLEGKGKLRDMSLYLRVNDNSAPYVIDELYVQGCDSTATTHQPKIISAAG